MGVLYGAGRGRSVCAGVPTHPGPLEGAGLCALGIRKASVARVCLAGGDGTKANVRRETQRRLVGPRWRPCFNPLNELSNEG